MFADTAIQETPVRSDGRPERAPQRRTPRVLLFGYNGANNTGSEARLHAIIQDVRNVLGHDALITVPTLNAANLRRYLQESATLRIAPIPSMFVFAVRKLVKQHDVLILVEGSTYMDTWTSVLLWFFLWATSCAHALRRPSLAYAVDAGQLSAMNQKIVRREASKTDFIVTRTYAAANRLKAWGVKAPIEVTADNAFVFRPDSADEDLLPRTWPEAASGVVGLAVVDFHLWPVIIRPWGRRECCYKWPYYFSRSRRRRAASAALAAHHAALADSIIERHGKSIALICMEELDEPLAREVQRRMAHGNRVRVFSSREYNASQMTVLLRSLDVLVTSRYHAGVLALAERVPQVALGHDLRLASLYEELGMKNEFFIEQNRPDAWVALRDRVEALLSDPARIREALRRGNEEQVARASRNCVLLKAFVQAHGWEAMA